MAGRQLLVVCECSGRVRDAFARRGWDAWSCDLKPSEVGGRHFQGDALAAIADRRWDLVIAHPPCTYLTSAGAWMWAEAVAEQRAALEFVLAIWESAPRLLALENPAGALTRLWRAPDQYVSPHLFGSVQAKRTGLWLRGLPPLLATYVAESPKIWRPNGHRNKETSRANRSRTDPALAEAMAAQWG
jgi:hypothetical protein